MRYFWSILLCFSWSAFAQNPYFVKNKGQWNAPFKAKMDLVNGTLFMEENAITFNFVDANFLSHHNDNPHRSDSIQAHAYRWTFLKSNKPKLYFSKVLKGHVNFFNTPNIATKLNKYQQIQYHELYDGIDYRVYAHQDGIKYDWIIKPHAKPSDIKMKVDGIDQLALKDGRLYLWTSLNEIREERPYAYQWINQQKVEVKCHFVLKNNRLTFDFPDGYDPTVELIIDPVMIFSSYSGSIASNFGYTATYDDYGFLYAGGTAYNIGYPVTIGAYQTAYNGGVVGNDVVLTKYDTTGSFLVYSTYLGGTGDEVPHSLIVSDQELFVMGTTGSSDFPVTLGAFDQSFNGGQPLAVYGVGINYDNGCDLFISRLDTAGSNLLASTFLGGTANDGFNSSTTLRYNYADQMRGEIDIDEEGNCYIASCTFSNDFPIVNSLIQPANNGGQDGIIVKLDKSLSNILWSSYWGGSSDDALYSLAIDDNNDIYTAGGTSSSDIPTLASAYAPNYLGGTSDAFVSHFSADGSSVMESTYFGSDQYDQSYFIELDKEGQVYLFGQSLAPDSTLISNAIFSQYNSGQFVCKLNPSLSTLDFSTVFGSSSGGIDISPTAFLVDACNRIYCSGWGGSTNDANHSGPGGDTFDLLTTVDAFQSNTDGSDFYLIIFEDNANALSYATFFGGDQAAEHVDGGTSRFDKKGIVYQSVCAGCGGFSDFPTTDNAYSSTNGANCNNAVFKFDPDFHLTIANFEAPSLSCQGDVSFENTSLGDNNTYIWDFGDGNISSDINPTNYYSTAGTFQVSLISNDPNSCNLSDTINKTITIINNQHRILDSLSICDNDSVLLSATPLEGYSYQWLPNNSVNDYLQANTYAHPSQTTTYYYVGMLDNCYDSIQLHVDVIDISLNYNSTAEICGLPIVLRASVEDSSQLFWSLDAQFSNALQQDTLVVSQQNTYYVEARREGCKKRAAIQVSLTPDCCSDENIIIPNAFTPNGDLLNDRFQIKDNLNIIQEFELQIFNRWGQKVFHTFQKDDTWDGHFKGQLQPTSVFDYHLTIGCGGQSEFFKKGNITLIR